QQFLGLKGLEVAGCGWPQSPPIVPHLELVFSMAATRRRRGEDGISFEHRGPYSDPERHRHCPGLWRGEITLGYTGDGKRIRRKVSGATKAAVVTKLRDLRHQFDQGITPRPGMPTTPSGRLPRTGSLPG